MPPIKDNVEVVGTLRLPLGGINGYVNVRGKQGRKKDKYQGCTPNKTRRTSLFNTPREAAVALAKLRQRPEELADPIRHINFASPALPAGSAALHPDGWLPGGRLPLLPELEPRVSKLPCVCVGMPMTMAQLSLAHMLAMPCVHAMPCTPNVSGSMLAAKYGA